MKYQKLIDKINSGSMTRTELVKLKNNAIERFKGNDSEAITVIEAIEFAKPVDQFYMFMGFCPDANIENRLDVEWKEKSICRFDFLESKSQLDRFYQIYAGDLVILKKREQFGKTMKLYGHGRVVSVAHDNDDVRFLNMSWSKQDNTIEVPLMACNSTVDIKGIEQVEKQMPEEFFTWLGSD